MARTWPAQTWLARTWLDRIEQLDPVLDCVEVYRITTSVEFPWDLNQALSFALFRTYAVPSIGSLLARTGEFTGRVQQRYEDTALLLGAVLEHGPDSADGRAAVRRINSMHGAYDISNEDLRYVLSTFVVMPIRWLDAYGWRPLSQAERVASVHYYRRLGALMGIRDVPGTWQDFEALMQAYEDEHFGPDPGARRVADATLGLLATLPPNHLLPRRLVDAMSRALMDQPLLDALGYARPHPLTVRAVRVGLALRGRLVRLLPERREPLHVRQLSSIRGYPDGVEVAALSTFPRGAFPGGCPSGGRGEG